MEESSSAVEAYVTHGLCIESSIGLKAPRTTPVLRPDVYVTTGTQRSIPTEPASGKLLAKLELNGTGYATTQSDEGYTIRFYSTCEFFLDPALERIRVHRADSCPAELAALLLEGPVLSTLLTLKGHCVLHASAVRLGDLNLAFVGPSGRGKSTLAAALCQVGARLISDDALRCDLKELDAVCFPGARYVRLRPAASSLVGDAAAAFVTVDGRLALGPDPVPEGAYQLHAVFTPRVVPADEPLSTARLSGSSVLAQLAAGARVASWVSPEMRSKQFSLLAALARRVPVLALSTPRGTVFSEPGRRRLASTLAALRLAPV